MRGSQRSVRARLTLDVSDYVNGTAKAEGATKRFGTSATSILKGVATGYAAIKLGGLVTESVQLEAAYSKTMAQVAVATNAPKKGLKELDDLAMKLGADTVFSAQESSAAMLSLAKGGLSPAQIQAGALADTLTLASAGELELADAADTVVQGMGAFRLKASQTNQAVAALAGGANASSASVSDMTQALAQAGTTANSAGFSIQETTAYLAMFANQGFKGSDAGTSLRTMLSRLVPQTDEARKAMQSLGLTYLDSNNNLVDAEEIAKRTQDAFKGLDDAQRISAVNAIFGADAQRAINAITAEGDEGLRKYLKSTNDLTQAQKLADAANSGTAGSLEQLDGAIETAKIQIGKGLAPVIQDLADKGADLAESGDFERWAADAADGAVDLARELTPLAKSAVELGREALPTVVVAGEAVVDVLTLASDIITPLVDGFNKLPDSAQQALILAAGAKSLSNRLGPIPGLSNAAGTAVFGFGGKAEKGGEKAGKGSKGFSTLAGSLKSFGLLTAAMAGADFVMPHMSDGIDSLKDSLKGLDRAYEDTFSETGTATAETVEALKKSLSGDAGKYADDLGVSLDQLAQEFVKSGSDGEYMQQVLGDLEGKYSKTKDILDDPFSSVIGKTESSKIADLRKAIEELGSDYDKAAAKARKQALAVDEHRNGFSLMVNGLGQYSDKLKGLPTKAITEITTPGAIKSKKDVLELAKTYELTPSQVSTVMKALGFDTKKINAVKKALKDVDGDSATVTLTTIQKTIKRVIKESITGPGTGPNSPEVDLFRASGGPIYGPGTGTSDSVIARVSNGEHVLTAEEVQMAGGQGAIFALRAALRGGRMPRFASGGSVTGSAKFSIPETGPRLGWTAALNANTDALVASTTATAAQTAAQARFDKFEDLRGNKASRLDIVNQRQQVRDLNRDLGEKHTKGKRKGQYVLTGLDREAAKLSRDAAKDELAAMKATNAELKKYGTLKAEKARLAKAEAAAVKAEAAAERAQAVKDEASSFTGGNALSGYGSAASFERGLTHLVSDAATFTQILADLKGKGASDWLIEQLRREGPTKAAIRIGRQLLTDSARLSNLNRLSSQYTQVGEAYGNLAAGTGTLTGGQRSMLIQVSAMDTSAMVREVVRQVTFQVGGIAAGGGI